MFLGIIVLVLALAGVGGWIAVKAYEGQVARAEAIEQKYEDAQKAFQVTLAQHDADRAADAKESAALIAQIAARAKATPPPVIQTGLKPGAAAVDVKNALQASLTGTHPDMAPLEVEGANLVATPAQAQFWVADELALTGTKADLSDTIDLLTLANKDKSSLSSDLTQCKGTLTDAQKSIAAYKAIAVKSRWRKFLDGALKVGIFAGGAVIGHAL